VAVYPAVPHDQIQEWLAKAHIGVLPFPDEEKFRVSSPIKLFEYMAAGMPVLTTRIECHTSVLQNEGNSFWAEESTVDAFVECLRQVWNKRDDLPAMGKISEKESQKWTWAESAANLGKALDYGLGHNE
jgi:glycosyltransferase involved in cell wall biosynthesis